MMTNETFTQLMLEKFKEKGCVSDTDIAKKIGIRPSTLFVLKKRDFSRLQEKTLRRLATALDMDYVEFVHLYLKYKESE